MRRVTLLAVVLVAFLAAPAAALTAEPEAPRVRDEVVLRSDAPPAAVFSVLAAANVTVSDGPFHIHGPRLGWNVLHATVPGAVRVRVSGEAVHAEESAPLGSGEHTVGFALAGSGTQVVRAVAEAADGTALAEGALVLDAPRPDLPLVRPLSFGEGRTVYAVLVSPERLLPAEGNLTVALFASDSGAPAVPLTDASVVAIAEFGTSPDGLTRALPPIGGARYGASFDLPRPGLWDLQLNVTLRDGAVRTTSFNVAVSPSPAFRVESAWARVGQAWEARVLPLAEGPLLILAHAPGHHEAIGVEVRGERVSAVMVAPWRDVETGVAEALSFRLGGAALAEPGVEGAAAAVHLQGPDGRAIAVPGEVREGHVNVTAVLPVAGQWRVTLDVPSLRLLGEGGQLIRVVAPGTTPGDLGNSRGSPTGPVEVESWWAVPGPHAALVLAGVAAAVLLLAGRRNG